MPTQSRPPPGEKNPAGAEEHHGILEVVKLGSRQHRSYQNCVGCGILFAACSRSHDRCGLCYAWGRLAHYSNQAAAALRELRDGDQGLT